MMGLVCWCHGPTSAPPGVSQCVVYRFSLQIRFPLSSPSWTSVSCCVPPQGHPGVHGGYELGVSESPCCFSHSLPVPHRPDWGLCRSPVQQARS